MIGGSTEVLPTIIYVKLRSSKKKREYKQDRIPEPKIF